MFHVSCSMKYYELTYLASPDLSEENLNNLKEKIISLLQERSGVLNEIKNPVKTTLRYPIKKKKTAFLVTLNFCFNAEKMSNFEKNLKSVPEILRYLILTGVTSGKPPQTPFFQQKERSLEQKRIRRVPFRTGRQKEPKVELEEIEKKLEEILGE